MQNGTLVSIHVGGKRELTDSTGQTWITSIAKEAVSGPVWAYTNYLEGDGHTNVNVHGGEDKAIYCYPEEHYASWKAELNDHPLARPGGFGENFTTRGLLEEEVCLGDRFQVGEAVVEIAQPHSPCGTLARYWAVADLPERVRRAARMGWFFRVLVEGNVCAGDTLVCIARPNPEWTIRRVNAVRLDPLADEAGARELLGLSALPEEWRARLAQRLEPHLVGE